MKISISLILLTVLVPFSASFAGDWAQYRGPNANGISPETGINKDWKAKAPKVLWKIPLTDQGFSVPSIAGGKAFILDHIEDRDIVRALDLNSGKELWKLEYQDENKQKWGFTRIQPLIDNGNLYVISRRGKVLCLDVETGKQKWELDLVKDFGGKIPMWGFAASPVIDGDKLIICPLSKGNMLIAVDKNTGKVIWRGGGDENVGYSTPTFQILDGLKQLISASQKGLVGVNPEDGKVLWTGVFKTKYDNNIPVPVVFDKNKVFVTAGYNHGCAAFQVIDNKVTKLWENNKMQSQCNSPILVDKSVYGIGDPGKLICIDPETGDVRWEQRGFGKGGIIVADGAIIAIDGNTGAVIMVKLDPEKYTELGRISPLSKDNKCWVPPVMADKKLLVRNRSELVCLDISE